MSDDLTSWSPGDFLARPTTSGGWNPDNSPEQNAAYGAANALRVWWKEEFGFPVDEGLVKRARQLASSLLARRCEPEAVVKAAGLLPSMSSVYAETYQAEGRPAPPFELTDGAALEAMSLLGQGTRVQEVTAAVREAARAGDRHVASALSKRITKGLHPDDLEEQLFRLIDEERTAAVTDDDPMLAAMLALVGRDQEGS